MKAIIYFEQSGYLLKSSTIALCMFLFISPFYNKIFAQEDWANKVKITAYSLEASAIDSIVKSASDSYVNGIEVDNDITGRYPSFLNPDEKLAAIKAIAKKAHQTGNHAFVYIAGLECITPNAGNSKHTLYKDHPDWVQRDINGKPAIFSEKNAFWIAKGDEDAWISPYAPEWRNIYMKRVRQVAATGIDGIYVDIPYWMTHFEGWEKTWASFDKYTVAAFKKETGLNAKKDIKLGDFNDPGFVQWVKFRMKTITEFLEEISLNIKSVNPNCKLIPEIYPGLDEAAVRVGADVYQIYKIADVITHEYSVGKVYAAERQPFDWFNYITGIKTFRAFAGNKPTWILSYSWYNNNVKPPEAMKSLFASEVFSGANVWDAKGYVMSSSNDISTRKQVYKWITANEDQLYDQRKNNSSIGIYFSPATRNMFPDNYIKSYNGMLLLLTNSHINYQIVTPRTLQDFSGKLLILDNAESVSDNEIESIKKLVKKDVKFLITKNTFSYDENRVLRSGDLLQTLFDIRDTQDEKGDDKVLYFSKSPGEEYYDILKKDLNKYFDGDIIGKNTIENYLTGFKNELTNFFKNTPNINIQAPIRVISSIAEVDNQIHLYLTDVGTLCQVCSGKMKDDSVRISYNKSVGSGKVNITPFLSDTYTINAERKDGNYYFILPKLYMGAIIRIDK